MSPNQCLLPPLLKIQHGRLSNRKERPKEAMKLRNWGKPEVIKYRKYEDYTIKKVGDNLRGLYDKQHTRKKVV